MFARALWQRLETIHAVTYFAPESIQAASDAGLRGFWMGYFGFRAAPLGPVGPAVVEATFANFAGSMVRRAIPDAWAFAEPATLIEARADAAATVLRRASPVVAEIAETAGPLLDRVVGECDGLGRPLFAANRDVALDDDPVARLWQLSTTLREHRGDGHVVALCAAGVDGCEAHALLAAEQDVDPAVFFDNRGWTEDQQGAAALRLADRGLLDGGALTPSGTALRREIESTTDALASVPLDRALPDIDRRALIDALTTVATDVIGAEIVPFPNPMGLPPPDES